MKPFRARVLASRRAAAVAASLMFGICLATAPAPALADQPDTDIICDIAESERQDPAEDRPDIDARNSIVVGKDGTVYYERDADAQIEIGSITKVMTAIVALENSELDDTVVVDRAAATVGQSSANLREGDVLTMEEALRGLLIPSGNDAAMAIATTVGAKLDPESDDPLATFVQAMNDKADEIGMDEAVFSNPHGLDFDEWEGELHASARDVAKMFAYAMQNEDFRALTSSTDTSITVTGEDGEERTIDMTEYNILLGKDGNIGGKTGWTDDAGHCFVGAFLRDEGGEIYTVVLGCEDDEARFDQTETLANWYYGHVVSYPVVSTDKTALNGQPLVARAPHADWTDKTVDVTVADPEQTVSVFSMGGDVEQEVAFDTITGNVEAGQKVGTLTLSQQGKDIATVDLVSAEDVSAPDPISWVLVQLDRIVRTVTGQPTCAEGTVVSEPLTMSELDEAA